jgi:hypothetical protein
MSKDRHVPEEKVVEDIINLTIRYDFSLDYSEGLVILPFLLIDLKCWPPST